jgi:hypothetical protein
VWMASPGDEDGFMLVLLGAVLLMHKIVPT